MGINPRKYLFIINPISGVRRNRDWKSLIYNKIPKESCQILFTEYHGHSKELVRLHAGEPELCIVAVGGDGTVSETAQAVYQQQSCLGIIPIGSGNGLARHFRIPTRPEQALHNLLKGTEQRMDLIQINDQCCCNTFGIGFTGLVTRHFGQGGKRGFSNYFKLALRLHRDSRPFDIRINGNWIRDVWSIEFANSSQMGNNAVVSPMASVTDGLMDILIMKKPKAYQIPALIFMVFSKNILKSRLSQFMQAKEVELYLNEEQDYHIDGDYQGKLREWNVKVLPLALRVVL